MELIGFRLANYETPLWSVENFSAGRFNRSGAGVTQYLCLHPLGPWAELLRNEDRRTRERAVLMRYPLWALRIRLDAPALELSFDSAAAYDIAPADLIADDHGPCHLLADRLRAAGRRAFTAPSAALPGTTNLIVLGARVLVPWEQTPIDDLDVPGSLAALDGRCPEGLWERVHYRRSAEPHAGLAAWEQGEPFVFEEPPVEVGAFAP